MAVTLSALDRARAELIEAEVSLAIAEPQSRRRLYWARKVCFLEAQLSRLERDAAKRWRRLSR